MANKDAIPPEHSQFKKGESGNPNGRPKGSLNRSTLINKWLEVEQDFTNPITNVNERLSQADIITLAAIKEAQKGNIQAFEKLMDSAFGKLTNTIEGKHEITGSDELKEAFLKSLKVNDSSE
jgi:hypothetical protein